MNFKRMFHPETMAVIGVSLTNDRNPANVIFHKNNLRYLNNDPDAASSLSSWDNI